MDFESIGWNCEFGMVQRAFGAEPLGLLRFTGARIGNLIEVLESGFCDFLSAEDFAIEVKGSEQEYMVFSRAFGDFHAHTNAFVSRDREAAVFAREFKKASYLKRRFEQDWRSANRVYVHSGYNDEASILKLHAALRARSDCALLWVVEARTPEERGKVEVRGPKLLRGHVAHYAGFDDGLRLDLQGWAMICRSAEAILRGLPEPALPVPSPIAADFAWSSALCGALQAGAAIGHCRVLHAIGSRVRVGRVRITAPFPAKSLVVFSIWVRLAAPFRGRDMRLTIEGAVHINQRRADRQDTGWQQIWVVARIVEPSQALDVSLEVEAPRGSEFLFGGWQIEEGGLPHEGLRPPETARFGPPAPIETSLSGSKRIVRLAARLMAGSRAHAPETSTVSSVDSLTAYGLLFAADSMIKEKLYDEADGLLLAGMLLFPQQAELFTHYAFCAQSRGWFAEAVGRWRNVAELFPQFALAHWRLAQNLRRCGETGRALAVIERALPQHRDDPAVLAEAAEVYAAMGRWPEALAHWDEVFARGGSRPEWHKARAHAAGAVALPPGETDEWSVPLD